MPPLLRALSAPVFYALELTPACNNRCVGCGNVFVDDRPTRRLDESTASRPLDLDGWRAILDIIAPHVHRLRLTGGEPTLHPDFAAIVRHVQALGLRFAVFSNGRWRDPARLLALLRDVPQFGGFLISLHGATADAHEAFSGVAGSFAETVENIRRATATGIPVAISAVLTRANVDHLPNLARLGRALGADHVVFSRWLGEDIPALGLSPAEVATAVRTIDRLRAAGEAVQFGVCIPQCLVPQNSSTGCYAGVAYCVIDPWGYLRPCGHSHLRAGSLLEQPLQDLWHGPAMEQFRAAIPAPCRECAAFAHCHGGCRAMMLEQGRDPLLITPELPPQPPAPPTLSLHPDWRPRLQAERRREAWGLALLREGALLAVRPEWEGFLALLDGRIPLRDLSARFGQEALALVGALALRHMVTFDP